jgi:hypothetical protein
MLKRLSLRATVLILTFGLGVVVATVWTLHHLPFRQRLIHENTGDSALSICELVKRADHYKHRTIRIKAILTGYHQLAMFDPSCRDTDNFIRADFDATTRGKLIKGIDQLKGNSFQRGNFWADVALSGQFEPISESSDETNVENNNRRYVRFRYRVLVQHIEKVEPVNASISYPE